MTFFGAFVRDLGGWIAVADLIGLMADLDLDEQAVRSAVSRLKRRGVVAPERRGGAAGYRLTPAGLAILEAGDARIFERAAPETAAPAWLLVSFSIPEAQRALRHRLRSRLEWLGLGTVAPAVWIGPAHVEPEVRALVAEFGLAGRVELFRAEHAGFTPAADALARWWDLDAVSAEYRGYLAAWRGSLRPRRSPGTCASSTPGGASRSTTPAWPPRRYRRTGPARPPGRCSPSSASACTRSPSATSPRAWRRAPAPPDARRAPSAVPEPRRRCANGVRRSRASLCALGHPTARDLRCSRSRVSATVRGRL